MILWRKVSQHVGSVLLLVNKIDLSNQEKLVELVEEWKELLPNAEIIPISAATKFNVDYVMKRIKELLPGFPLISIRISGRTNRPVFCKRDYPRKDTVIL